MYRPKAAARDQKAIPPVRRDPRGQISGPYDLLRVWVGKGDRDADSPRRHARLVVENGPNQRQLASTEFGLPLTLASESRDRERRDSVRARESLDTKANRRRENGVLVSPLSDFGQHIQLVHHEPGTHDMDLEMAIASAKIDIQGFARSFTADSVWKRPPRVFPFPTSRKSNMTIRDLIKAVEDTGPYNFLTANCHHGVQAAFTSFLNDPSKAPPVPFSGLLTRRLLTACHDAGYCDVGTDSSLVTFERCGFEYRACEAESVYKDITNNLVLHNNCRAVSHHQGLKCALLSQWIYQPNSDPPTGMVVQNLLTPDRLLGPGRAVGHFNGPSRSRCCLRRVQRNRSDC
eukprot:m.206783 g.206783  ORF g.206783 m.206783 type:complete len:346 (-) comp15435_c0_seq3:851-1888(-)